MHELRIQHLWLVHMQRQHHWRDTYFLLSKAMEESEKRDGSWGSILPIYGDSVRA